MDFLEQVLDPTDLIAEESLLQQEINLCLAGETYGYDAALLSLAQRDQLLAGTYLHTASFENFSMEDDGAAAGNALSNGIVARVKNWIGRIFARIKATIANVGSKIGLAQKSIDETSHRGVADHKVDGIVSAQDAGKMSNAMIAGASIVALITGFIGYKMLKGMSFKFLAKEIDPLAKEVKEVIQAENKRWKIVNDVLIDKEKGTYLNLKEMQPNHQAHVLKKAGFADQAKKAKDTAAAATAGKAATEAFGNDDSDGFDFIQAEPEKAGWSGSKLSGLSNSLKTVMAKLTDAARSATGGLSTMMSDSKETSKRPMRAVLEMLSTAARFVSLAVWVLYRVVLAIGKVLVRITRKLSGNNTEVK